MKFRCEFISEEGFCADYDNRPDICRDYPESDLYFMGGELTAYCGFRFDIVPSFKRFLKREIKRRDAYSPPDDSGTTHSSG